MSLDLDIRMLLRSNEVKQINFTMRGIVVSGHGYHELSQCFSDAIQRRRIRVTVRPELVGPRALAVYSPDVDKIHLRAPTVLATAAGRAAVVHECTHAQLDLRGRDTATRSEEGAAFIAEAWYLLACGQDPVAVAAVPAGVAGVAAALRDQAARAIGAPVAMTDGQIDSVRRDMAGFGYGATHYRSDGIRGHFYRGP